MKLNTEWLARRAMMVAWAFTAATAVVMLPREMMNPSWSDRDVPSNWLAQRRIQDGEPLYPPMSKGKVVEHGDFWYLYPPVLAPALSLAPRMSFVTFSRCWSVLLFASFWAFAAALARIAHGRATPSGWAAWVFIAGAFPGAAVGLGFANVDPVLWALAGWGVALSGARRGALLALVAVVKPYAVFPLAFAAARDRRAFAGAAAALAGSVLVGMAALSPGGFVRASLHWLTEVLPHVAQGWAGLNLSPTTPIGDWLGLPWIPVFLGVLAPVVVGVMLRHRSPRLQVACVLVAGVFASPYVLIPYLPLALVPIAVFVSSHHPRAISDQSLAVNAVR